MADRPATTNRIDAATVAARTMEWDVEAAMEAEELERLGPSQAQLPSPNSQLVLGRYRLTHRLGSGGFGTVYAARDERLRREVAVKVIPRDTRAEGDRAEREARVAARLNHPSVVALYELGADASNIYLVSELVDGRTLAELIAEDALSDRDVARIGAALCEGLGHAHQRGVVHRDVKPQNVMVVAEPAAGMGFAKLTDFGVAHLAGDEPLTRTGDVVGTLAYMAPEQADGRRVTWEADVYALALSLYEAWTGVNPVRRRGPAATARQVGKRLPSLGRMRRDLPPELCRAIDQALDPRPERRPQPEELALVFREVAGELSDAGALDGDELREPSQIRPRLPLLGRVAAGAGAAVLTFAVLQLLSPSVTFQPAEAAAIAGVAVAVLPRLGWIATALMLCTWLAAPTVAREGMAVVLLAAVLPVPLLLPRAPGLWSLPAAGPVLAAVGAGPAYAALAGQASSWGRRAAVGALGFFWVGLGEAALRHPLMFGLAPGQRARGAWLHDGWAALSHGILPLFGSALVLCALVWALCAAILPLLVRGVRLAADIMAAAVWASVLFAGTVSVRDLAGGGADTRGVALGTGVAAVAAVVAAAARRRSDGPHPVP
ncbi:MAG: protein kinase domain-containing protein [Thermoleophilaceae bacterium]